MSNEALRGIDFTVRGVVNTDHGAYVVLIDEMSSMYFPVPCQSFHAALVEAILSEKIDVTLANYGLYFSLLSIFKAHDMSPTQIVFIVSPRGGVTCSMEVVESNELGMKISRIPMMLPDAVAISAIGKIPVVVYGSAGTMFTFKIGKDVPKQNVFSFVCEEIAKSERLASIGSSGQEQE